MLRYFDQIMFCKVHSVDPINVMNLENMQRSMFYLTSRDAKRAMTTG